MKIRFLKLLFILFLSISSTIIAQVEEKTELLNIEAGKSTVRTRFSPPRNYKWQVETPNSFGDYLVNFPLYPKDFPVRDFNEIPIAKQYNHAAILKIDVGEKDLQQCADAWIRLYAEYLFAQKKFEKIGFHFTSGQFLTWKDYEKGIRTEEVKDRVKFIKAAKSDSSYENFRDYLDLIFRYAGTISLNKESEQITNNEDVKVGDFLIKPGSPGHSVIIVGISKNISGQKLYLLAESFMPAQDIHILINPVNKKISPWYELDVNSAQTITAKYIFKPTSIKRFKGKF
ncbi:DUF4846 domain-containing protein [Halpernia frigidisoli]|uniref:DUF4846 domain-containing protein n=1 Tax=Halpernia frigidisoli TaxID=1125876 RepID=A0A1I3F7E9_9FLAO|nr:DUF4846 domain-containing protein [Halpernia frigidisoli]SFI07159.1 protein of unknown function (4846) [Halpernia frigidisoli]